MTYLLVDLQLFTY